MFVRGFEPPHDNVLNVTPLPLGYTNKDPKAGFEPAKILLQREIALPVCSLGIKLIPWKSTGLKVSGQNRTDDKSFADSCLTTWRQTH